MLHTYMSSGDRLDWPRVRDQYRRSCRLESGMGKLLGYTKQGFDADGRPTGRVVFEPVFPFGEVMSDAAFYEIEVLRNELRFYNERHG